MTLTPEQFKIINRMRDIQKETLHIDEVLRGIHMTPKRFREQRKQQLQARVQELQEEFTRLSKEFETAGTLPA